MLSTTHLAPSGFSGPIPSAGRGAQISERSRPYLGDASVTPDSGLPRPATPAPPSDRPAPSVRPAPSPRRPPYLPARLVVVQVHEAPGVFLDLAGVHEAPGEVDAVAHVGGAAAPLPALGLVVVTLLLAVAPAVAQVALAAGGGDSVGHAGGGDGIREGGLTAPCVEGTSADGEALRAPSGLRGPSVRPWSCSRQAVCDLGSALALAELLTQPNGTDGRHPCRVLVRTVHSGRSVHAAAVPPARRTLLFLS